jgi:thiol-disulfide isomerase/thioredoxin
MLAALDDAPVWLNSEPLTAAALRGRPVAVQFWTYSCVNWLRTLPYVAAWAERYADRGLVVVGAHAPEFGFEHDLANVRDAIAELGIAYPVVIDNDFAIWRAFNNRYWPALYLLDGDGRPRYEHFGEEAYAEEEEAIQGLLGVDEELAQVEAGGLSAPADWANLRTPETYVAEGGGEDWELDGRWRIKEDFAVLEGAPGSIAYRFEGRDVNLVMGGTGRFTVRLDGEPPGEDHGLDAHASGEGTIAGPRMYQLIRGRAADRRTFEITFHEPGARAYVFTFG